MADFGILDLEEGSGDSGVNSSRCLVGKVFQGKNLKAPILYDILKVAWRTRAPFYVDEWNNNVFLFRFETEEDRRNIIQEGPWSVMNNLLVLIPLVDGMVVSELKFNVCPFWVQIHGLPVEKLSRANAEIIGKRMGVLLALEAAPDGFCLARGFLRIRVEINIEHPLPRGFWLRGKTDSSRDRWVSFKFEKLSDFCYGCGRIGHDNRGCRFVTKEEGENSGYGPELRTSRAKRSAIPVEVIREEVNAAEIRVQNLILRRPEIQVQATGARVDHGGVGITPANDPVRMQQEHGGVVESHPPLDNTTTIDTSGTGVKVSSTTGSRGKRKERCKRRSVPRSLSSAKSILQTQEGAAGSTFPPCFISTLVVARLAASTVALCGGGTSGMVMGNQYNGKDKVLGCRSGKPEDRGGKCGISIMLRGCSGFSSYRIFEHQEGCPDVNIYQGSIVFKLEERL
ncbi:hypothetical protein Vadar_032063 [Vaccinium darrowii]|uniref:Uncharacterized protein n=1 Tax=Vaccinium darrowii TaxID=229202 RepID=A0ACB7Z0M2_9ERIC|nr:hypothetical protein Vadar_032063 [Vaccinium darrowii]